MAPITIDDETAIRLIHELAEREGKSTTQVVVEAVTEKVERDTVLHVAKDRDRYWADFGDRMRNEHPDWNPQADLDALYDPETGLPA